MWHKENRRKWIKSPIMDKWPLSYHVQTPGMETMTHRRQARDISEQYSHPIAESHNIIFFFFNNSTTPKNHFKRTQLKGFKRKSYYCIENPLRSYTSNINQIFHQLKDKCPKQTIKLWRRELEKGSQGPESLISLLIDYLKS